MLISPDPLLRSAWAQGLRRSGAARVDEIPTLAAARSRIATGTPPDLIVVDTCVGRADLLTNALAGVAGRVVLIGDPDTVGAVQASLQAGARGYLFGRAPTPTPMTPTPTHHRVDSGAVPRTNGKGPGSDVLDVHGASRTLSAREIEILQHAADGESNTEIGDQLGLSALTIKSHLSRIGRRLGSGDRAQMVLLALRSGAFR